MKRSDMVNVIQTEIQIAIKLQDSIDLADSILMAIEKAGMLPPKAEITVGEHSTIDHLWEPEEDTQLSFDDYCCERGCNLCLVI